MLKILDLGCAAGININQISKLNKTWKCHGADLSPRMIIRASKRFNNIQFFQIDVNKKDPVDKYDIIYMVGLILYSARLSRSSELLSNS